MSDYDGTLATDGEVDQATRTALQRVRASGRKLVLVTGRQLPDLFRVFPHLELFDRIVAENGALLYNPGDRTERTFADPPPEEILAVLERRGVSPLSVGRVIRATSRPHETTVLQVIHALDLDLQIILNKDAVMILPLGVDKASGVDIALLELGVLYPEAVGVGDAENDLAFLSRCGCAVAVANALDSVKQQADLVTAGEGGAGVVELIERLLQSDLQARP